MIPSNPLKRTVSLQRYKAEWWDRVEWGWRNMEILAISEEQARRLVDKQCAPEHRIKPQYGSKPEANTDSLKIESLGDVVLPCEI